jgi:hypothetical protein
VTEAVISRADATAQVSSTAVAYYEKTFGVSPPVARARLASQLMGQGIENTLRAKYGSGIAGVAFDNATGNWVVDATPSVTASGIAGAFSHTGLSGAYRLATVRYTQSDLVGATADLTGRLHDLIRRRAVQVVSGAGKVTVTVASAASQADRATIQAAERSAAASYSSPPITQTPSSQRALAAQPTTVSCSEPYCNTLVAGDFYYGNGAGCTMSWYGSLRLSGVTQPLILTAGHCTNDMGGAGSRVYSYDLSSSAQIGYAYFGNFGYGDWGYLYPTNPPPSGLDPGLGRPYGGYFNWATGTLVRLSYYYNSGVPSNGVVVCHQGEGSWAYLGHGTECGTVAGVTSVAVSGTVLTGMLQINSTEACLGDSGGPWDLSSSATAVGIQSSAAIPTGSGCGTTAWATPVSIPLQAYSAYGIVLYGG